MAMSTIKGSSALGFERGFALRNLLHLVGNHFSPSFSSISSSPLYSPVFLTLNTGDLHQPLHSVARFSPQTPNGDQGGNLFPVANILISSLSLSPSPYPLLYLFPTSPLSSLIFKRRFICKEPSQLVGLRSGDAQQFTAEAFEPIRRSVHQRHGTSSPLSAPPSIPSTAPLLPHSCIEVG